MAREGCSSPIECKHCPHGWHGLPCDEFVTVTLTQSTCGPVPSPAPTYLSRCACPASAPQVPTVAEYLAGKRNPDAGIQVANLP